MLNTTCFAALNVKDFHYNVPIPKTILQVVLANDEVFHIFRKIPRLDVKSMSQSMIDALATTATGSK